MEMALNDGTVNDGDGNRILEYPNYFPPNFMEYMLRELKWSRFKSDVSGVLVFGWVFWSRLDHQTLPHDNFIPDAPASLNVKDKIRHALQKSSMLHGSLLQFWAPTTTMEGRTLLTTQNQPFALSRTTCMSDRQGLCDYRLVSTKYRFYADAESGEEELGLPGRVFLQKIPESAPSVKYYSEKEYPQRDDALRCNINGSWALPVFEHSSNTCVGVLEIVSLYYSTSFWHDKYFLYHLYDIFQEFRLQFFDGYTHCRMRYRNENKALTAAFRELRMVFGSVCKIHKLPLALTWVSCSSCIDLLPVRLLVKGVEYFEEGNGCLTNFLEVSKGRHLRKGQVTGRMLPFPSLLYCSDIKKFSIAEYPFLPYARQCKLSGWFAICLQSIFPGNEVYILEFFLPVRSKNDENILTTLSLILGTMEEHFETFKLASGQALGEMLPLEIIDFQNGQKSHSVHMIQATRISRILELVKDGGLMLQLGQLDQPSMDAINNGMNVVSEAQNYNLPSLETLQNGKVAMQLDSSKHPSMDPLNIGQNVITPERNIFAITSLEERTRKTQERELTKTGVRIEISLEDILKCSKMSRNNAAQKLEVSVSTLKRVCRGYGIDRWPPRNIKKVHSFWPSPIQNHGQTPQLNYDLPSNQASTSVVLRKPGFQDAHMLTIRVKYDNSMIKFRLSLSSRLVVLQQEVAKRLNLDPGTYNVKYVDEEDELILIACDEDLQDCMHTSRSQGITSIVVQLEPKQPITPFITCLNTAKPELSPAVELIASKVDLLTEILVRLPVKSIARFKCVSKHWLSLLASISGCLYYGGIGEQRPSTVSGADSGQVSEHSKVTKEQTLEQIQVSPKQVQSKQSCSTRSTKETEGLKDKLQREIPKIENQFRSKHQFKLPVEVLCQTGSELSHEYVKIPTDDVDVWELDPVLLKFDYKIATGSCKELYKGTYGSQDVAITVLMREYLNTDVQREFGQEVFILRKVRHKSIVQFIGACTRPPSLCIVTEYMSGGSVFDYLHKWKGIFTLPALLKVAIDVSKGMNYLHHNKIVHRDLKAANLLMDENNVVKVAGFGVAEVQTPTGLMTAETGTYRWMAPEVIEHKPYDGKADVFSFGIVLWELLTGKVPYEQLTPLQAAVGVVQKGLRPIVPPNTHPKMAALLDRCWQQYPSSRPDFSEITEMLHQIVNEVTKERKTVHIRKKKEEKIVTRMPFLGGSSKHADRCAVKRQQSADG